MARARATRSANWFVLWCAPWRNLRTQNIGWRIDYVLASPTVAARATGCVVEADVDTSDHAPGVMTTHYSVRRDTLSGNGLNFVVDDTYTYSYDDRKRPLSKFGALTILNGPNAGRQIQTSSVFSYY